MRQKQLENSIKTIEEGQRNFDLKSLIDKYWDKFEFDKLSDAREMAKSFKDSTMYRITPEGVIQVDLEEN